MAPLQFENGTVVLRQALHLVGEQIDRIIRDNPAASQMLFD